VQGGSLENLKNWSPSLEIMLRKAPETQLSLAMVSGVLMRRFVHHPLTLLRHHRPPAHRRVHAGYLAVDHPQRYGRRYPDQFCAARRYC